MIKIKGTQMKMVKYEGKTTNKNDMKTTYQTPPNLDH